MALAYLRYLAREVPPGRLVEAAVRRVWRVATQTVLPLPIAPSSAAVLSACGVASAEDLPRVLRRRIPGPLALGSVEAVRESARALRGLLPREAEATLALAERAWEGRIRVFGRDVTLRRTGAPVMHASSGWIGIDWEADPWAAAEDPSGAMRLPIGRAGPAEERRVVPLREPPDPKRQWVVGRLEEVVHLACGAAIVRQTDPARADAYATAALDRMVDFARAPRGIQWTCAMEVALRAANVAIALRLLAADPVAEARPVALLEILRSLALHVAWVQRHLEDDGASPNNHLVADWAGILVVAALVPWLPGAGAAAGRASRGLARELERQVLPDGFSFEGSVGYHRLALEMFTLGELAARQAGVPLPPAARQRLVRMFRATLELHDPVDPAPCIGDDDSGRALPFLPRGSGDMSWILSVGAASLGVERWCVADPGAEVCWLLGAGALEGLLRPRGPIARRDGALPHAGIHVLRSARITCAISCGPNGTAGLGTHGHNDKLSFELRVDGRPVVVDPGSGSYTGDPGLRNRLRGTAAHSTLRIDGAEQQALPEARLFALPEQARARCVSFESRPRFARFVGEHAGYRRSGIVHRRTFHLDREAEALSIEDWVQGEGVHRIEVRFTLADVGVELIPARAGGGAIARIVADDGPAIRLEGPPGAKARVEEGVRAVGYGELARAVHLVFEVEGPLPLILRSGVSPARAADDVAQQGGALPMGSVDRLGGAHAAIGGGVLAAGGGEAPGGACARDQKDRITRGARGRGAGR